MLSVKKLKPSEDKGKNTFGELQKGDFVYEYDVDKSCLVMHEIKEIVHYDCILSNVHNNLGTKGMNTHSDIELTYTDGKATGVSSKASWMFNKGEWYIASNLSAYEDMMLYNKKVK